MLTRLAMDKLQSWKNQHAKRALMIMGARQVGKTTLVREFARQAYEEIAEVNFYANPQAVEVLSAASDVNDLMLRLSVISGATITAGRTLLFLDEIQECQDMLTWVKFLLERNDIDLVISGSLLGLDAYADARSLPVGFLEKMTLYPLSFKEYALATGIAPTVWERMEESVLGRTQVPDYIHEALMQRFRQYLLIGGMPDAVQAYVETSQIGPVRAAQSAVFDLYEADISKYVADPTEARQIRMVYEAIPGQLNTPSKRFKYARLGKNLRFANMETAFDWLSAAGVAIEATRIGDLSFPLGLTEDRSAFKLFPNDVGILTSRLMGSVDLDVISGRTDINFGSIYESVVAQELFAQGVTPHYYSSKKHGEIDFVIEDPSTGRVRAIEVKSGKSYKRHNALSGALERGDVTDAVVLCNQNVSAAQGRIYLPVYAASLVPKLEV